MNFFKKAPLLFLILISIYFLSGCRVNTDVETTDPESGGINASEILKINANKSTINLTEGSNTILLVVSDKPASKTVTINWELSAGASGDFVSTSGMTHLLAGETSFSVTVNTINDTTYESTKNYTLSIWSDDKLVKNNLDIAISLTDDDPQYSVAFSSSSQTVTEASGLVNIPLTLSNSYGSDVTISYSLTGTATENSDYSITGSGSIVMTSGNTSVNIPLNISDDSLIESSESIVLTITGTDNTDVLLGSTKVMTITLNDNDIGVKPNAGYLIPNETLSLTVTGGDGSYTYAMVGTPASTINSSGVITASPTAEMFTVRVADGDGNIKDVSYEVIAPKSDTSLKLWLKASELGLNDGDPVTTWTDLTVNGNNVSQSTSSSKPQFVVNGLNSKPVVRFDGSDDFLDSNYLPPTGSNQRSVTVVITGLYKKSESPIFSYGDNNLYGNEFGLTAFSQAAKAKYSGTFLIDTHDNTSWASAPYVPETTKAYVITIEHTGTANRYYINGEWFAGASGSLSTGSAIKLKLGKRHGTGASNLYYKGDIAEMFVHETTLTDDYRKKLQCYLSRIYDIPLVQTSNCGVETLEWKYRGSISVRTGENITPEAFGGVPPYSYSVVSGSGAIDSSTGLFSAAGTEGTTVVRVKDLLGQTADLTIDTVGIPIPLSWMNLAKGATGYSEGSKVTYIRDISGNENHYHNLSTSISPTYRASSLNSQPVLEFSGAQFLSGAFVVPTGSSARSFAFVVQNTVSGSFLAYGGMSSCGHVFQVYASTNIKVDRNCGTYTSSASVTTAAKVYVVIFNGSTLNIYENGVSVFSGAASFNSNSSIGLKLGANYLGTSTFLNGDIAEFMAFNSALSGSDRAAVESYLSTKFGL